MLCTTHCFSKGSICCQLLLASFYIKHISNLKHALQFRNIHSIVIVSTQKCLETEVSQSVMHCLMRCITHPGLQAQLKEQKRGRLGEAPEGCFSGLEVSLLLPGGELILKGHALRALPPAEAHVTHSQHNSPQGQVPGIVCLPCQPFSAALHCQAIHLTFSLSFLNVVYNPSRQKREWYWLECDETSMWET